MFVPAFDCGHVRLARAALFLFFCLSGFLCLFDSSFACLPPSQAGWAGLAARFPCLTNPLRIDPASTQRGIALRKSKTFPHDKWALSPSLRSPPTSHPSIAPLPRPSPLAEAEPRQGGRGAGPRPRRGRGELQRHGGAVAGRQGLRRDRGPGSVARLGPRALDGTHDSLVFLGARFVLV